VWCPGKDSNLHGR